MGDGATSRDDVRPAAGNARSADALGCRWSDRLAAAFADSYLLAVVFLAAGLVINTLWIGLWAAGRDPAVQPRLLLLLPLLYALPEITHGQTLGKYLTELRIVPMGPVPDARWRLAVRWVLRRSGWIGMMSLSVVAGQWQGAMLDWYRQHDQSLYSFLVLVWLIHPLGLFVDPSRGTWDWVCGTRVVRTSRDAEFAPGRAFEPVMPPRERDAEGPR
jgi:hypothetical protein